MAYSSILGAEVAAKQPGGRDSDALGPSDNSDSGSDTVGTTEAYADSDAVGTGERGSVFPGGDREGGDILPDRVVNMADAEVTAEDDDPALTDLDAKDPGEETDESESA